MLQVLKNLFGKTSKVDLKKMVQTGAQVIDVRTKVEFQGGHISGSVNIPLQSLESSLSKIKKDKPVITCCASGMRSATAKSILMSNGFSEVHNGGAWISLRSKIS
ncbi:MAG: sulfurtransferase [Bacteroidetes bacterium]|nr:MAG: sulfurtransferase [Bacteroidota bacterium]